MRESREACSPVGVLILGRKRPGFDQEWNQIICRRSLAAMRELGINCIEQDGPVIDDLSLGNALKKFRSAACEVVVMLQPSAGNGQLSLSLAQQWLGPIVLWATPERPGDGKPSSNSLVGQHIWSANLRQSGHPFELVYGDPDDARLRSELMRAIALSRTALRLNTAKVGVIGGYAPGYLCMAVDPMLMRRSLGVQIHSLSLMQFVDRVKGVDEQRVREDVCAVKKLGLRLFDVKEEDLAMNSRVYLAIQDLMKEECLDAVSVQCWPELPDVLGQWPYLAISRLTTEGRAVSMEGDADGAVTELIGNWLELGPGFLTDWLEHDQSTIFLWHPGMAPLSMCYAPDAENGPVLARHFNIVKPLVVDGQLQTNRPATITRLWHCDNQYFMTAREGKAIPPRRKTTGNSILVEVPDANVPEYFDNLIHAGMPHHVHLYYGHCAETLRRFARIFGIRWVS